MAGALLKCDEETSSNESPASLGLLAAFASTVHSWNIASCDKRLRSRSMRLCFERTCYTSKGRKVEKKKKEKRENSGRGERRREKRTKKGMYRTQDAIRMAVCRCVDHTLCPSLPLVFAFVEIFLASIPFERIQDPWCRRKFWLNSNYPHRDRNSDNSVIRHTPTPRCSPPSTWPIINYNVVIDNRLLTIASSQVRIDVRTDFPSIRFFLVSFLHPFTALFSYRIYRTIKSPLRNYT